MIRWDEVDITFVQTQKSQSLYYLVGKQKAHKGVFINTLVGGGWAIENFCRQTFLTPLRKPPKLFEPPINECKNFFDPPIATCIISVSFLNTNLFGMHHRCTSITGNT